jgi:hypothetical protein
MSKWAIRGVNAAIGGGIAYAAFTLTDVEPWKGFVVWIAAGLSIIVADAVREVFGKAP